MLLDVIECNRKKNTSPLLFSKGITIPALGHNWTITKTIAMKKFQGVSFCYI